MATGRRAAVRAAGQMRGLRGGVQHPQAKYRYYREQEGLATWGGSAKQAGSCGLNRP